MSGARGSDEERWRIVEASFVAAAQAYDQLPPPLGVELAFAGRSNVGKSSLMNALTERRKLVRTSSTPGCTRQLNFFEARARDGAVFRLVDLPGYGYAKRSKAERALWADLIEAYLAERDVLRAVVVLVDARRGVADEDEQLIAFVRARPPPRPEVILVATKIDKIPNSKRKAVLSKLGSRVIGASGLTSEGIDTLWRRLRHAAHVG